MASHAEPVATRRLPEQVEVRTCFTHYGIRTRQHYVGWIMEIPNKFRYRDLLTTN